MTATRSIGFFTRCAALLLFALAAGMGSAQPPLQPAGAEADPPARVGVVTAVEGSLVFAPPGETEWTELARNRPITRGDRLWTDEHARAELHLGSSVVQLNGRTFFEVLAIDDDVVQLSVNEGAVNARARELRAGDNFEIATPQLALRATQPGDWLVEVDPQNGVTRVTSHAGMALLYGAGGNVRQIAPGQQLAFAGRDLTPVASGPGVADPGFERWAVDRNRAEDESLSARFLPRDVVGYSELDRYGMWSQDPNYGAVWFPQVATADWAPYRYGRWDFIDPWGWTWVDDAPWGFAPFHYGRWAMIRSRWAWVPGPLGRHPVYAPALVGFVGGEGHPGIGWYPLAPGEIWRPFVQASPVYVRNVNRYLVGDSRRYNTGVPIFLRSPDAITSMRLEDFHRGRPVASRWTRINAGELARFQPMIPPAPTREMRREFLRETRAQQSAAPQRAIGAPAMPQGLFQPPSAALTQPRTESLPHAGREPAAREQAMREQQAGERMGRERAARERATREHQHRQQQDGVGRQQAAVRQQHEAMRQQQAVREIQSARSPQHPPQAQQQQQQRAGTPQPRSMHFAPQVQPRRDDRRAEHASQRQAQREDDPRDHRRR